MSDERWKRILKYFALVSALIALFEGFIVFDIAELGPWPYFVSTVQNAVHTFLFDADISVADAYKFSKEELPLFEMIVSYLYMTVVLLAPVCSSFAVYSAIELMLHRKLNPFMVFKREPVLVFGEHESLAAAIVNEDSHKYHFYLATKGAVHDDDEELELLRKQTVIIPLDSYDDYDNNIEILRTKVSLKKLNRIVIAQETMADTLTLYMWICKLVNERRISRDVKIYALCNGFGGERVLEEIYEGDLKKAGMPELITYDSYEISARKIIAEHPPILSHGNVHILLTGFSSLAMQLAANLMNAAVSDSSGKITIDIVDADVHDGRKIFARRFSSDYFKMTEDSWKLAGDHADGELLVRFHEADPKEQNYKDLLMNLQEEAPFTYAAICLSNADEALSAMFELKQVLRQSGGNAEIPIGLRIDANDMLAESIKARYEKLFTFDEKSGDVTMDDIFYETIDAKAKEYNYIYNSIYLLDKGDSSINETVQTGDTSQKIEAAWKKMLAFQRTSSRLLADHAPVKAKLTDSSMLKEAIGQDGTVLRREGNGWRMLGDDADFLARLEQVPALEELARLEHRRWCYAMAIMGWSYAPGKKDPIRKTNPCLVSWEKLKETRPGMCKYDLMPYMSMMLEDSE